jgi:archaellum component FlaC
MNIQTDREVLESIARRLDSIESEIGKLKENLVDTHELMNNISNRMVDK